jgi:spore coat protein CotH
VYRDVGVKLKGAAGSFRSVDDNPAMTLHFSKWANGRRLFGLRRLHLNNSVQDESHMNEYLGSDLFRAAGVPTPRVDWAMVRINERKLGLYVLKEAFESEFLRIFFGSEKGNLYDGGFVRDIEQDLVKESGTGQDDRSDLHALYAAIQEKDITKRWVKLGQLVDVDQFVTYAALSVMLADWDGYPLNRNNYRIYFRPSDGRAVFMPHGMDQLFQHSDMELDASWTGSLAWSLFGTPEGQKLYEDRCRQVFTNVFKLERMTNVIAQLTEVLRKAKPDITSSASDLKERVERRYRNVRRDQFLKSPPAIVQEAK